CVPLTAFGHDPEKDPWKLETDAKCVKEEGVESHPFANAGRLTCQAAMAIYVDQEGNFLYLENVLQDPTRIVRITPRSARGCTGGSTCYVCPMPNRCGCVC